MDTIKENDPDSDNYKKNKAPLFLRRENGSGWNLNISSPLSYLILAVILAIPFAVVIWCICIIKK